MKRYKPEQIIALLRQIEVEIANGKTTPQTRKDTMLCRKVALGSLYTIDMAGDPEG